MQVETKTLITMHNFRLLEKTRLFLTGGLFVTALFVLTSTSCNKKEVKDSKDVVEMLDSVKSETPDLKLFGLKGKVKTLKDEVENTYNFTEDGMLDVDANSIERDDSGRIVKMQVNNVDVNYTWDENDFVIMSKSVDTKNTYRYDDRGYLLNCFTEVDTWEMSIYKYLEFDDHGNWIKRERQWIGITAGAGEGEDPTYKNMETE